MLTACCIERDISIKCEKRADAEKYSEYLIRYPFRRMRGRENEGVEQRFDSAECGDYHHTFPHLFLLSCRVTQRSIHVKSFRLSLTLIFFPAVIIINK